jgi:5-deoxy-glucuronate isomerase
MTGMTKEHITAHRRGFERGFTPIARQLDPDNPSRIGIGVLRLAASERSLQQAKGETAWLLMSGSVRGTTGQREFELSRDSLFDESASCVHAPAGSTITFDALRDTEIMVFDCANSRSFDARVFTSKDVPDEPRGRGQVGDRALRYVRTVFDRTNSPESVELVLGEVVTFPGGWSSYPPHHHPQPEIYHYRFTLPQGYGHAELGDSVVKVMEYDTIHIPAGLDHAQCAAPGYGMYYSWVIRHLPGQPYTIPDFTAEHTWTLQAGAPFWRPREMDHDE